MTASWNVADEQEEKTGEKAATALRVDLYGMIPPIEKMEPALNTLAKCEYVIMRICCCMRSLLICILFHTIHVPHQKKFIVWRHAKIFRGADPLSKVTLGDIPQPKIMHLAVIFVQIIIINDISQKHCYLNQSAVGFSSENETHRPPIAGVKCMMAVLPTLYRAILHSVKKFS